MTRDERSKRIANMALRLIEGQLGHLVGEPRPKLTPTQYKAMVAGCISTAIQVQREADKEAALVGDEVTHVLREPEGIGRELRKVVDDLVRSAELPSALRKNELVGNWSFKRFRKKKTRGDTP